MSAAARIAKVPLTPYDLISFVSEEYEHRQLAINRTVKKVGNSAFTTDSRSHAGKGSAKAQLQVKGASPDAECYNCHHKGHSKSDCWSPGGGKKGQRPKQDSCRGTQTQKQTATIAAVTKNQKDFMFASTDVQPVGARCAIIDSGATSHFCPDRTKFITFSEIAP
jgi:hypothetical protein